MLCLGEMGAIGEEEMLWETMQQEDEPAVAPAGGGERIRVWIRLRPLNEKEIARNEVSDWECIDDRTILFHNSLPERAMFPDPPRAYSFGDILCTCLTCCTSMIFFFVFCVFLLVAVILFSSWWNLFHLEN